MRKALGLRQFCESSACTLSQLRHFWVEYRITRSSKPAVHRAFFVVRHRMSASGSHCGATPSNSTIAHTLRCNLLNQAFTCSPNYASWLRPQFSYTFTWPCLNCTQPHVHPVLGIRCKYSVLESNYEDTSKHAVHSYTEMQLLGLAH